MRKPRFDGHYYNKKSMDIEILSADQSLCGHLINLQGEIIMDITKIGITIPSRAITTMRNMDMFMKIA